VKNIERIELGRYEMETWYFSPFPDDFKDCKVRAGRAVATGATRWLLGRPSAPGFGFALLAASCPGVASVGFVLALTTQWRQVSPSAHAHAEALRL
jgi:MYST family zinc finger domain